jgi:Mg-chelatase subunit ChlD
VGKEGKVEIDLKAQRSQVKMGEVTVLPAMCSIVASGGTRTSVDLICVIDVSGSMDGEKIELVKETMRFLIETLTPSDRLSILTFNSSGNRICGLKTVTQENMVVLSTYINNLFASGGTNIMSGMDLALKTIRDRKIPNKVTSVFLLSDGQDKGAE